MKKQLKIKKDKMKIKVLVLALAALFIAGGCSYESAQRISLQEGWEYAVGGLEDGITQAESYSYQPVDSLNRLQLLHPEEIGVIWLRREFTLNTPMSTARSALFIESINPTDVTYLNGQYLGSTGQMPLEGKKFFSFWNDVRNYSFQSTLLEEVNTIHIKVYLEYEGSISGKIFLDEEQRANKEYILRYFTRTDLNMISSIILFFIGSCYLFLYLLRKKEKVNLFYSLMAMSYAVFLSNHYVTVLPISIENIQSYAVNEKINHSMIILISYSFWRFVSLFIHHPVKPRVIRFYQISMGAALVLFLAIWQGRFISYAERYVAMAFGGLSLIHCIVLLIYQAAKKANRDAKILLWGFLPFMICILLDIIHVIFRFEDWMYFASIGLPIFMLAVMFILAGKFQHIHGMLEHQHMELQHYREELEDIIEVRTKDLRDSLKEISKLNEELRGLSETDDLTGLYNRRKFDETLKYEWGRTLRFKSSISLLMMDLDHFKEINDRHGHLAGDEVLRQVAGKLESMVRRSTDFLARYGGEEFALVLPNTPLEEAIETAEKIRKEIEKESFVIKLDHEQHRLKLTISIGLSTTQPLPSQHASKLIGQADHALYEAKRRGRNQVREWIHSR